ncbi:MAG: Flp pilus assembly complex ATPase component TadA [Phycisphaerales bacterium]|nr:Flp pilus assembly complex ATPase component TadA [Phycisphaerales bacterium]
MTGAVTSSHDGTVVRCDNVSARFVARVPIAYARRFGVLGLKEDNGPMPLALKSPEAAHAADKIAVLLGVPCAPFFAPEADILRVLNEAYGLQATGVEHVIDALHEGAAASVGDVVLADGDLLDHAASSQVTKLVNLVLLEAVQRRASDVHVQPWEHRVQVRLRIDGVLYDFVEPPPSLLEEIVSRIKVMGRMNIAEKRLPQDGRTTVKVGDKTIDLRISTLPTCYGERVVLRLLDKSARLYRLTELGMSDRDLSVFRRLIRQTHGILLVTGPTGSGKSTTLYAALQELNAKELNIVTLEDPIEYQLPGISQTQVSDKKGMTFATGLRTVLRQDPDVIMVGEIRDEATARMAIQSSLTGHLVFSTLHTNDAAGAVTRLIDLGVEPYLVAGSLLGVVAQRLIRCVCPECRVERPLTAEDAAVLAGGERIAGAVFDAGGCTACHETGYRDRIGVFEMLTVDEAVHALVTAHPKSSALKQAARKGGMTTLREDAVRKLLAGLTTVEEVLRVTKE